MKKRRLKNSLQNQVRKIGLDNLTVRQRSVKKRGKKYGKS